MTGANFRLAGATKVCPRQFTLGRVKTMKSILRTAAAGLAIASFGIASAASAATEDAQVTANILSTLQLSLDPTDNTLNFADIADDGLTASSTVTVEPDEDLTCGADLL